MLVRASSGSGGGGSDNNVLIYCDMYTHASIEGVGFYDTNYFNLVSGSQKTSYQGATNITLSFKKSGAISLFYYGGTNDASNSIDLNSTSIKPTSSNNWKTDIAVSSGDTIHFMLYPYYSSVMVLFNPDMSVYTGDCPYST